jgi:tRNA-dependent cyclodipeptide synthase
MTIFLLIYFIFHTFIWLLTFILYGWWVGRPGGYQRKSLTGIGAAYGFLLTELLPFTGWMSDHPVLPDRGGPIQLQDRRAILLVSVGQDYHEGEELSATLELAEQAGFRSLTVMLADTLQRHNLAAEGAGPEAHALALARGDEWISRNAFLLHRMRIPVEVVRWDECLYDTEYAGLKVRVVREYHCNRQYQEPIDATITRFIERTLKRNPSLNVEHVSARCLEYLLEECPIIMPLWAKQGYDFIIYPLPMTDGMRSTHDLFVRHRYPDKAQWLSLKFKRKAACGLPGDVPPSGSTEPILTV